MKRQSILLFLSMLVCITFFSCTSKTIKTEEKDFEKRYYLDKDTAKGSLSVNIDVEIPVEFVDSSVLKSIRSTIISNLFGIDYVKVANDSVVKVYAQELLTDYLKENQPSDNKSDNENLYSYNNEHIISGFSLQSDKIIYVYGIERYAYMGGDHDLETRNYFNFDLKTGKLITETDLFNENYQSELSKLIKARIIEEGKEYKDENNSEIIKSLEDIDSIKSNGNFYITDESINYVFNPYEIAPYNMGQTQVTLPFNRLKNILKPNSIIDYLVKKHEKDSKK